MKTKIILLIFAAILVLSFILGASGVVALKDNSAENEIGDFCGLLVTRYYPNGVPEITDEQITKAIMKTIMNGGEYDAADLIGNSTMGERRYAKKRSVVYNDSETGEPIELEEYYFDGVHGGLMCMPLDEMYTEQDEVCLKPYSNEYISGVITGINAHDGREDVKLEGTLYIPAIDDGQDAAYFYSDPVFQLPDGSLYSVRGKGMGYGKSESPGEIVTIKAEIGNEKNTLEAAVHIVAEYPTESITIKEFKDNELINEAEYSKDNMPDSFTPQVSTDYIIIEKTGGGEVCREMLQNQDDSFDVFDIDGEILLNKEIKINWK